jgi:hypothetical protein
LLGLAASYLWQPRVLAWDEERERLEELRHRKSLSEAKKRHATMAQMVQSHAISRLNNMTEDDLKKMSLAEACKVVEMSSRMELKALGEPDQTIKSESKNSHHHSGNAGSVQVVVVETVVRTPDEVSAVRAQPNGDLIT